MHRSAIPQICNAQICLLHAFIHSYVDNALSFNAYIICFKAIRCTVKITFYVKFEKKKISPGQHVSIKPL